VAGYTKSANGSFPLPATTSEGGTPVVVDSFTPSVRGNYTVNAMAVGSPGLNGGLICVGHAASVDGASGGYTAQASTDFGGRTTLALNGILRAGPSIAIKEICRTDDTSHNGKVARAQITAVQVSAGHKSGPVKPANSFSLPKLGATR
jgi:hypothetical protein